jgi:hypothetical protein
MTSKSTFPRRLTKIDALTLPDHSYLTATDTCCFLGEYSARQGYAFSATNSLVLNFKKSVAKRGLPEWQHKERAIAVAADAFKSAINPVWLDVGTLVPMPPSKAKTDPLYDDRLVRMLRAVRPTRPPDMRELIIQTQSTSAVHDNIQRPRPADIEALYQLDTSLLTPAPKVIGIFDDVLTTGAHFKAAQAVLQKAYPGVQIIGFFIARRVPEAANIEDFDDLDDLLK